MDVIAAYRDVGSYRGAAEICGTTHKTVKRIIEAHEAAQRPGRQGRGRNFDQVKDLVEQRVEKTSGRSRRSGCCRRRGRRAMPGRPATSVAWSRR